MKIDETKLPLDLQAIILTGMNFEQLCNYIAENVLNDYKGAESGECNDRYREKRKGGAKWTS